MGLLDTLKGIFVAPEDEEMEEEMDILNNASPEEMPERPAPERRTASEDTSVSSRRNNKIVNIHATTQLQVVLVKPERFDEASAIADHLNSQKTVVLNLETASKEVSRRLVDFLSGVAYANNGKIQRVANSTFIITPNNVDIMGDLLDELESNGFTF